MNPGEKTADPKYISSIDDPFGGGEDKYEISKYLASQGTSYILEIGPGAGSVIERAVFLSKGWHRTDRYFAIDLNRDILDQLCQNTTISSWPYISAVQADATRIPFKSSSFDIVNLSSVAHEISSYGGGKQGLKFGSSTFHVDLSNS